MEYANADNTWPEGVLDTIQEYREDLEARIGKKIGDAEDPLLVSVRSGAPMSMPGMMDTVLNLGLNDESIHGLIKQTENPRFAWDSYRRFIQMFSNVVMNLDGDLFENAITTMKRDRNVESDTDLSAADLEELVAQFKQIFSENVSAEAYPSLVVDGAVCFPQDPDVQLQLAIEAVFGSWNNPRAILYRKQNKISDDLGTAVNVQSMIFGNKGETSATGVAFTRNPANGEKEFYGDYLVNAQGEDVVAGIRNTSPIADLKTVEGLEEAGRELEEVFTILENHFRDMCDIEFTIEQGKLWMLQTRVGKRTAAAALHIAIEMEKEGLITKEEAVQRVDLLDLSRLESQEKPSSSPRADLHSTLVTSYVTHKNQAEDKGLNITFTDKSSSTDNCYVSMEPSDASLIFDNLIENAIMYTDKGCITISLEVHVKDILVTVEDTGIGIPQADQARIFERFYRVDKARSREVGGTGLGLSLVRHAVDRAQGTIKVKSEVGKGTRFSVILPKRINKNSSTKKGS